MRTHGIHIACLKEELIQFRAILTLDLLNVERD